MFVRSIGGALLLAGLTMPVVAQEISIKGDIFSVEMLEGTFEQRKIVTITSWTGDALINFSGPTINDVIEAVGILPGADIVATAADGYTVKISRKDIDRYHPILAITQEGKPISFEEKGPVRIVWPRSEFPEITIAKDGYWIWYLEKIGVAE